MELENVDDVLTLVIDSNSSASNEELTSSTYSQPTPLKDKLESVSSPSREGINNKFFMRESLENKRFSPKTLYVRSHYNFTTKKKRVKRRLKVNSETNSKHDFRSKYDIYKNEKSGEISSKVGDDSVLDGGREDLSVYESGYEGDGDSTSDVESGISCGSDISNDKSVNSNDKSVNTNDKSVNGNDKSVNGNDKSVNGNNNSRQAWSRLLDGRSKSPKCGKRKGGKMEDLSVSSEKKRKMGEDKSKQQMILDAGQSRFGAIQCGECGMIYSAGEIDEELAHNKFHHHLLVIIKFKGWKCEKVAREYLDGRVIRVDSNDPKYAQKKVTDLLCAVDSELGYVQDVGLTPGREVYMYVTDEKKIVGCCVIEQISEGHRIVADPCSPKKMKKSGLSSSNLSSSTYSSEVVPTVCGVNRMWTLQSHRRRGIATRLLDAVGNSFIPNTTVERDEFAFSDPTALGKAFASRYSGRSDFLIYTYKH